MKTPEEMAKEYAEIVWDESELAPEDRGIERHVAIGRHSTKIGFLAGYTAGFERAVQLQASLAEYIQKQNPFDANNHGESINLRIPSDQELHLRAMTSLSIGTSSHTNIQFIPGTGWVKKI